MRPAQRPDIFELVKWKKQQQNLLPNKQNSLPNSGIFYANLKLPT